MSVPHTDSNVCVIFAMKWEGQVGERRFTLSNEVGGASGGTSWLIGYSFLL